MFQELAPDLFIHDGWKRFYGFRLHRWMTVVRLSGGRLFVHSPNALDEETRAELDRLGQVAIVVAPNKMHNHAVDRFAAAYPSARFFAAPGLPERRPDLRFEGLLGEHPAPEWADEIDQAIVAGNAFFSEVLFLHRATGTLIVTDLVENIHAEHVGPFGRVAVRLLGLYRKARASPEHRLYTLDPEAAEASLAKALEWEFDRIVLAHGRPIESDGKAVLQRVVDEMLSGARRRGRAAARINALMARWQ